MAVVALDMDGVLADFMGLLFRRMEQRHGLMLNVSDVTASNLGDVYGWREYDRMKTIFNEPGFFAEIEPYPGAIDAVNTIIDAGHHVEICTSPTAIRDPSGVKKLNPYCLHEKIEWIARYLPRLAKHVTITKAKWLVSADYLVDDADYNIGPWCERYPDRIGLVVDQPWNRRYVLPTNAKRITIHDLPRVV